MTYPVGEPTPLEERMRLHKPGQVTWPEPKLGKRCRMCEHFVAGAGVLQRGADPQDMGGCDKARTRNSSGKRIWNRAFPASAIACSVFERVKK